MELEYFPARGHLDWLAAPTADALVTHGLVDESRVVEIDPDLADTLAMTEAFGLSLDVSANCVVISGRREGVETIAACVILATTKADVNNFVRKHLNLRKASFLSMDRAVELTGMEYGGITPIGLPADWPVLVDSRVDERDEVILGSGLRRSKLFVKGSALGKLPNAQVLEGVAV